MSKLINKISTLPIAKHAAAAALGFLALGAADNVLNASYARSQFPVNYFEGQTAFNAETIKSYYQFMIDAGTLNIYWQTQLLDFFFIASVFIFGLTFSLLVRRIYLPNSLAWRITTLSVWLFPLGASLDASENLISFVMLAQPLTFPAWIAPIYSGFAALKFAAIVGGMAFLSIGVVAGIIGVAGRSVRRVALSLRSA